MKNFLEKTVSYVTEKSPMLFTGAAAGSSICAVILATKATPKAVRLLEERREKFPDEKISKTDAIKTTWKCYIPTTIMLGSSIFFMIMAHRTHTRKNAALAAALSMSEQALQTFTQKSLERIGEKKTGEIKAEVIEEAVAKNPPTDHNTEHTGKGDVLFYIPLNGRYFYSDIENVRKAINDFNYDLRDEMMKPINDLFYNLGIASDVYGNCIGYNINYKGPIDYDMPAVKATDGKPCLALELYNWDPFFRDKGGCL